jgi:hypothetical protein
MQPITTSLAIAFVSATAFAQQPPCTPSLELSGTPCIGDSLCFELCAEPGCFVCLMISLTPGPSQFMGQTIPLGPSLPLIDATIPPTGECAGFCLPIPNIPWLAGLPIHYWSFGTNLTTVPLQIAGGPSGKVTICSQPPVATCVVIIDEDTIDNDLLTVEQAAAMHSVAPDYLVNDDNPVEIGNPWLRWNTMFPGDIALIPGGQVDDEGLFALPPSPPFSVQQFVAGTVPQSQLDPVFGVMPLRNQDLARLIGTTCVAIVYDSDISMNYLPIQANLQGARYGRFAFTVLDVVLPGTLPESGSSTSLYDLLVRVEGPIEAGNTLQIPIRDHEPDSIQIVTAEYSNNWLTVTATSNFAPNAVMTLSVEGFTFESPMPYHAATGRYRTKLFSPANLDGRRVTISTNEGGAYNAFVQ